VKPFFFCAPRGRRIKLLAKNRPLRRLQECQESSKSKRSSMLLDPSPTAGTMPSCCIMPRASQLTWWCNIFPFCQSTSRQGLHVSVHFPGHRREQRCNTSKWHFLLEPPELILFFFGLPHLSMLAATHTDHIVYHKIRSSNASRLESQ
jgi:hypothetical protein